MASATSRISSDDLSRWDTGVYPQLPPIPRKRYFDPAFHDLEMAHVFKKIWLFVGHVCEYPTAGSYRLLDVPFAPVVLVRGRDDTVRAFINTCAHRGATVLRDKQGCAATLTCQYHAWSYNLEGKLIGITSPASFPDLDKSRQSLPQLRCEQWGGFLFINFDKEAEPLLDWLPESIVERYSAIAAHHPERPLRLVSRKHWQVNCNWKSQTENFWETYHVNFIHANSNSGAFDTANTRQLLHRNGHCTQAIPAIRSDDARISIDLSGENSPLLPQLGLTEELARHLNLNITAFHIFPTLLYTVSVSGWSIIQVWPIDVDHCRIEQHTYAVDWGDKPMPDLLRMFDASGDVIVQEDQGPMSEIHQALKADPDGTIQLGSREISLYNMHGEIDRCIGIDRVPAELRVPDVLSDYFIP